MSAHTAWSAIETRALADEAALVQRLIGQAALTPVARAAIVDQATALVRQIRARARPGMMEVFLAEYGLSTDEGIALMCLAEALLRVPDAETMDALIEDKIAPSDWGRHLGHSASSLVNASTWALMLTGRVLNDHDPGMAGRLRGLVRRLGEPVIRLAVGCAMKEMGRTFVLGETIEAALTRAAEHEVRGYTYSYDMLGEAARTDADARRYHLAYTGAISAIARAAKGGDIRRNPGLSVKLSALHPRYEVAQRDRVLAELVPRVQALAHLAKLAGLGLTIDAEEADRLALSLQVIRAVLADPALAGWDGFGAVVQAYGRRAGAVVDWLYALATELDRKITVRLVKGAYWDAEVKRAQVLGLSSFPVFTRKEATDVSFIATARRLLRMTDRIYPQFATHNAHTAATILYLAGEMGLPPADYEFQRLHGMGEALHDILHRDHATRCRIYAPVGAHRDLLAYLVRRLLENGANSSFVHQIVDGSVPPEQVVACPLTAVERLGVPNPALTPGAGLFLPRQNSKGWDLTDAADLAAIHVARAPYANVSFTAAPRLAGRGVGGRQSAILNPANGALVGHVTQAAPPDIDTALRLAEPWSAAAPERAHILRRVADALQADAGRIFALLAREGGKTLPDAVAELREAVDFLRYYAEGAGTLIHPGRGVFACISPWNFPLAIFCGQVAAALAAGNGVIAKPAEQTPLIAALAVDHLLAAGVPGNVVQLLPGDGKVGAALTRDARVDGVAFTGSTDTALTIRRAMADHLDPTAPLIAETGGLNAMLVDSTALPEQAVRDIIASAFQSAGQRCSALRCLYLQEDVADTVTEMLFGAMEELTLGDPWQLATDIGPVIDGEAQGAIREYIDAARAEGRVMKELVAPAQGSFVGPTVLRVGGIADMPREIFGPVLHLATFRADEIDRVIQAINATGYGLTFGLHSRIDDRVERVVQGLRIGNIYVNRNQIGAVVGSQPFGGEGMSGTGPKAGGPHYLARFTRVPCPMGAEAGGEDVGVLTRVTQALARFESAAGAGKVVDLPGPIGESNRLHLVCRPPFVCLGPGPDVAKAQARAVRALGGGAVEAHGLPPEALTTLSGFSGAVWWGGPEAGRPYARALAARQGPILPLVGMPDRGHMVLERHLCIDTTAAGGNARLLAEIAEA